MGPGVAGRSFGAEPATGFGADYARIMAGLGRETFTFEPKPALLLDARDVHGTRLGGLGLAVVTHPIPPTLK